MRRRQDAIQLPQHSGVLSNSDKPRIRAHVTMLLGCMLFIFTVYMFAQASRLTTGRSLDARHLSTGDDEGLAELVPDRTASPGRGAADPTADPTAEDDGSIIVDTATKERSVAAGAATRSLPPAAALRSHHDAATDAAATAQTINELPDPAGTSSQQHPAVHAARMDPNAPATGLYALSAVDINGQLQSLSKYAGRVTVVVNVASQCGFTDSNYKGLQQLYEKYSRHGLEILAFPCNQFGAQEPGTAAEIAAFAKEHYHTAFPLFQKVDVNGPSAHEVFKFLKSHLPADQGGGKELGWNFQKFIVDRSGQPVKLHTQAWDQAAVEQDVYGLLRQPAAGQQV